MESAAEEGLGIDAHDLGHAAPARVLSCPVTTTAATLASEEDREAIQETLHLQTVPGLVDSVRRAREEGVEAASEELDW